MGKTFYCTYQISRKYEKVNDKKDVCNTTRPCLVGGWSDETLDSLEKFLGSCSWQRYSRKLAEGANKNTFHQFIQASTGTLCNHHCFVLNHLTAILRPWPILGTLVLLGRRERACMWQRNESVRIVEARKICCKTGEEWTQPICCIFCSWCYVCLAPTHPSSLKDAGNHDNRVHTMFPDHPPEVRYSVIDGSCAQAQHTKPWLFARD